MIDRTEHDARKDSQQDREMIDDDAHADHSVAPDEHHGPEPDLATEEELREHAEPDA